jgi:DnaK suppressor protein
MGNACLSPWDGVAIESRDSGAGPLETGDRKRVEAVSWEKTMSASEIDEYRPSENEPFMSDRQKEYFKKKLLSWKQDILKESKGTLANLQEDDNHLPDIADRASSETEKALELRTRDRQRKLISKIDSALRRIETGEYGYCEETAEPIGVRRLDARPIATLSLEAQERHEREEKVYRDD